MSNSNTNVSIVSVVVVNSQSVNLTYSTGTNPPANNNGNVAEVEGQGAATVTYSSGVAGWTVCGYLVTGAVPSDMNISTQGNSVVIRDTATATTQEQLNFALKLKDSHGHVYTSPDPLVVNEPPR